MQIYHHVGENFDNMTLLGIHHNKRNGGVLNLHGQFFRNHRSGLGDYFTSLLTHSVLSQSETDDTVAERQFFIEFITSDFRQIITPCVKEHIVNQALCAVHSQRLTRTELFI